MPIENELIKEIEKEDEERLRTAAKNILRAAVTGKEKRRGYIKKREAQIVEIETIQSEVYAAYDKRDMDALKALGLRLQAMGSAGTPHSRTTRFANSLDEDDSLS